jgi:hypothetical protein
VIVPPDRVIEPDGDLLAAIEHELAEARQAAARAVDRAQALTDLHALALGRIAQLRLRRPLRPADLWDSAETRAQVDALLARVRGVAW